MNLLKQTKKYKIFEVDLGALGLIILKDPLYYETKVKLSGETSSQHFSIVEFIHKVNGKKSRCECFQADTLGDLEYDVKRIRSGQISGTNFYSNWMKLLFLKGKSYTVIQKGEKVVGDYVGQDTFKRNTHYFLLDGKKVTSDGLEFKGYKL